MSDQASDRITLLAPYDGGRSLRRTPKALSRATNW